MAEMKNKTFDIGIRLGDGKYTFYTDEQKLLHCNRYGEEWRDFIGDNAVSALYEKLIESLEENRISMQALRDMAKELRMVSGNPDIQDLDWADTKVEDIVLHFVEKHLYR